MAYTDLVSSQVTLAAGGGSYNFAFDTPVSADPSNSPHISHMGIQLDLTSGGAQVMSNGPSAIITQLRVKVGTTIIMNWNNNATTVAATLSQLGCLVQRLGGKDFGVNTAAGGTQSISELVWPVGLDATRSHRVNISITLANEAALIGAGAGGLTPASSEMNVSLSYGRSTEATIVGSQQSYAMSVGTRAVTVYGKQNWNMLGLFCASDQQIVDDMTSARVNNGAFRELTVTQWRSLNNSYMGNRDATSLTLGNVPDVAATGVMTSPTSLEGQAGSLFMNLRRISAGASIDIAFTFGAASANYNLYPIWVAPLGTGTGTPPRQTIAAVSNPSATVESGTQS